MKAFSPRLLQNLMVGSIIVGILLLALGGYFSSWTGFTLSPLISVQTWLSNRYQAINTFLIAPRDTAKLQARNVELEAEIALLRGQIVELQQQIADIEVLKALVKFASANPENQYLAASVIGRDPSPFLHYIIINRGSNDQIRRGMPVVTQQGLVGRISAVTAGAARVRLITDPAISINVHLQPSKTEATLIGSITGEIQLERIPLDAPIQNGDLILTSGLGANYPANLFIGQVTSVRRREYDLFQTASLQPAVDFKNLNIVMIIINFQPIDTRPLLPSPTPGT